MKTNPDTTLRDELEKKLRAAYFSATDDVFGVIADEVIRQMEWAQQDCCAHVSDGLEEPPPIRLAPDGWKP